MGLLNSTPSARPIDIMMQDHAKPLSSIKFSTFVYKENERMNPVFLSREVLLTYKELDGLISTRLRPIFGDELKFVKTGLERIPDPEKQVVMNLTPTVVYQLRSLINAYGMEMPHWLPEVFKTESLDGKFPNTYLFNWGTVNPSSIGYNDVNNFISLINDYLSLPKDAREQPIPQKPVLVQSPVLTLAEQSLANSAMRDATVNSLQVTTEPTQEKQPATPPSSTEKPKTTVERRSIPYTAADDSQVEHNLYVARKYIQLHQSAASRGLQFNLTLDDVDNLLRTSRCHYSDVELVAYQRSSEDDKERPDNYLTIDRMDNSLGYVRGNVVACAQKINQLKDQMPAEEFQAAMTLKRMMAAHGMKFNPQQLAILGVSS